MTTFDAGPPPAATSADAPAKKRRPVIVGVTAAALVAAVIATVLAGRGGGAAKTDQAALPSYATLSASDQAEMTGLCHAAVIDIDIGDARLGRSVPALKLKRTSEDLQVHLVTYVDAPVALVSQVQAVSDAYETAFNTYGSPQFAATVALIKQQEKALRDACAVTKPGGPPPR